MKREELEAIINDERSTEMAKLEADIQLIEKNTDYLADKCKELEADKLRQENYCESLVNENKRLNEIIISKDMVGAVLVNENKALRHNLEDWKYENEALKQRIKELEANQPNEYKEEKYFYTRLVNWLDKNENGRVNPHHESGCPAIFKELTTKAQNEWKELADKLPSAPKSED